MLYTICQWVLVIGMLAYIGLSVKNLILDIKKKKSVANENTVEEQKE